MKKMTSLFRSQGSSSFWLPLLLGLVLAAVSFLLLTLHDRSSADQVISQTMDFATLRVEQYTLAMENDQIKSEIRLLDKTFELSRRMEYMDELSPQVLDAYAYNQRLTGIVVLDENLEAVCETTVDGDTMAFLRELVCQDTVREILQYPVKSYMTRKCIDGKTVDFAAVSRRDAKGLVVAYMDKEPTDEGDWQLSTLFDGCVFERDGIVIVTDGAKVVSTNYSDLLGADLNQMPGGLQEKRWFDGHLDLVYQEDGQTWYGGRMVYESYVIYVLFPSRALFELRNTLLVYGVMMYIILWLCFWALKTRSMRRQTAQNALQLRIIASIAEIFNLTALVDLSTGKMRILKHPSEQVMAQAESTCWDIRQTVQRAAEKEISPEYREHFLTVLDMKTLPERLEGKRNLSLEYQDVLGRTMMLLVIPQEYAAHGKLKTVLLLTQDVTAEKERELAYQAELRRTAEEARRASMAKTDFLRRMSHDIRTPINGIRGMVEISRHYSGNEEKQEECRQKVMEASAFLLSLVSDVLNMNKLESGEITLESKPVNLRQMIESVLTTVEAQAWEHNICIEIDQMALPHENLIASPLHLRQIMQNIVGNAVKYNREGGSVHISCRETACDGQTATISFVCADTGRGMSQEFQAHAFDAFAQEDVSARTSYKGTGLGLAIVHELVERMNGEIRFESTQGVGTTFYLTLPLTIDLTPPEAKQPTPETAKASIQGMNVLLVEDNALNMEISEFVLQENGAHVTAAWNGQEAVRCFLNSEVGALDCILMDMMMPVMNGEEATRTIRAADRPDAPTIPIIAMTANAFAEDEQRSRQVGMNAFLTKPVDEQKMLATMVACVNEYRRKQAKMP